MRRVPIGERLGIGFGSYGDKYVRVALIENQHRIRQALRGIKKVISG